ncbi:hypothetical protein SMSP2_02047 [Limihaloglobus sulfuriphilus]|uniref:Uncharacterized protein n=1 Tax=Limihaloglobus sulfuriphilus TaxID=1851148 RepID=A0A1Q2MG70_9BACT|nr:hypothetical protein [Limihaloglobus sulfuriphilus]AQQ71670.1 hypothetical protein SMSP2_02047 [Limihaloglobus sulfuriphilus]
MNKKTITAALIITAILSPALMAGEKPEFGVGADFMSKYIWRGILVNDDYSIQPWAEVSYMGITAGWWSSWDTTDYTGNESEFIEHDFYLDYTMEATEGIDVSLGYIYYAFPSLPDTQEVYAGAAFDVFLSPYVTVYYDFDAVNSTYATAGIGYTVDEVAKLSDDIAVSMELGASLGWGSSGYNKDYWGVTDSEFSDYTLSAAFPFAIGNWTLTPSVNYVGLIGDIDDASPAAFGTNADGDYFFTGIGVSTSF